MDEKYIVYGAKWCNFCNKALDLLDSKSLKHFFADLSDKDDFLKEVKDYYDSATIPVILRFGESGRVEKVGGFTDLKERLENEQF